MTSYYLYYLHGDCCPEFGRYDLKISAIVGPQASSVACQYGTIIEYINALFRDFGDIVMEFSEECTRELMQKKKQGEKTQSK